MTSNSEDEVYQLLGEQGDEFRRGFEAYELWHNLSLKPDHHFCNSKPSVKNEQLYRLIATASNYDLEVRPLIDEEYPNCSLIIFLFKKRSDKKKKLPTLKIIKGGLRKID